MKMPEVLIYFTAADYLRDKLKAESQPSKETTGREESVPFDTGLKTELKIYGERVKAVIGYPVVLIGRLTGISGLIMLAKDLRNDFKKQQSAPSP